MAGRTVLVLGGGVGGLATAGLLRRRLGREHRVVLVDREAQHQFAPSLPWVMVSWKKPESTWRPFSTLRNKGIEFLRAAVTGIEAAGHKVYTDVTELSWDYLVIALGTEMTYEGVEGLAETAHSYYTLSGAVRLRDALQGFQRGKVAVVVAGLPYRCPAAPYEGALLIDHFFRKRGLRGGVDIKFFTPEPAPLPVAGPAIGDAVKELFRRRDIAFNPATRLASVNGERKEMVFGNGTRETFDLLVTIPQHRVATVIKESGLTGESGWVPVDRHTMATEAPGVYALGDATFIKLASGLPLPKAGVFAHRQAEVVAENIVSLIQGRAAEARFDGHGSCFVETGYRRAGMASGNFFAEPVPRVTWRRPSLLWHWGKAAFEWRWFSRWF